MPKAARASMAVLGAGAALALGLALAALASSTGSAARVAVGTTSETTVETTTTRFRAAGTAKAEVPKPIGVPAKAGGALALTLTQKGSSYSARWTLTFHNLSGKAIAAHVHRARVGKAGPVLFALCGPCTSGKTGSIALAKTVVDPLRAGLTYVNVHTNRNKAGEIRGQITRVR